MHKSQPNSAPVGDHGGLEPRIGHELASALEKLLGADDPFVKAEDIEAFELEMLEAGVDYRFENYPDTKHGFTNPEADQLGKQFSLPLQYNQRADELSWVGMKEFFEEIFEN